MLLLALAMVPGSAAGDVQSFLESHKNGVIACVYVGTPATQSQLKLDDGCGPSAIMTITIDDKGVTACIQTECTPSIVIIYHDEGDDGGDDEGDDEILA